MLECCDDEALPELEGALALAGASEVADISGLWRDGKIVAAVSGLDCLDADERARFAMAVQRLNLGSSRTARLVGAVAAK